MSLDDLSWWPTGMMNLRDLHQHHGREASTHAASYAGRYQGQRAAMVFDVVASRQRRYNQRVEPMVEKFKTTPAARDLDALAEHGPGDGYGLRAGEAQTMQGVAAGLLRHCQQHGKGEEDGVGGWATSAAPFEHAPKLEPYVGSVKGMGPALLAYLRMRCGADAIKPDLRVRDALNPLGFQVPNDEHAILVVAHAAADHLRVSRLVLDQLLWWPAADPFRLADVPGD